MMTDENANDAQVSQQSTEPELKLRRLDRLVGTWEVSGGLQGKVSYEWMEGGFFLIQRFDFDHDGRRIKGFEVIGRERMLGAEPSEDIKTGVYTATGDTLEYTYELEGTTSRSGLGIGDLRRASKARSERMAEPTPAPGISQEAAVTR
jgi:hypothetical protein